MLAHRNAASVHLRSRSLVSLATHCQHATPRRAVLSAAPRTNPTGHKFCCVVRSSSAAAASIEAPAPAAPSAAAAKADVPTVNLEVGQVYDATITTISAREATLDIKGRAVNLQSRNVSRTTTKDMTKVFTQGEQIKVIVTGSSPSSGPWVSTKALEPNPGMIKTDKQAVFDQAEQQAEVFRAAGETKRAARKAFLDSLKIGDVVKAELRGREGPKVIFNGPEGQALTARLSRCKALGKLRNGNTYELHVLGKLESGYPILGAPLQPKPEASEATPAASEGTPVAPAAAAAAAAAAPVAAALLAGAPVV